MGAKNIVIKVLPASIANEFVRKFHYSGKVVNNSTLHFGCFYNGELHGVMSYGSPLDKRKVLPLVVDANGKTVLWNEMLELNRMAFDDLLPRNSESRAIAISVKLIKKNAPHIRWLLSFSDATQCGDGTIYRASGFSLTQIRESSGDLWFLPEFLQQHSQGSPVVHRITIQSGSGALARWCAAKYGTFNTPLKQLCEENGGHLVTGFQMRYILILDKTLKLSCDELKYSEIDARGAGMYKGDKITILERQEK